MWDITNKELDELEEQAKKTNLMVPVSPETLLKLIGDLRMWRDCVHADTSHLLHWTTKTPTELGWYWCRSNVQPKDAAIVLVRDGAFELDEELIEAASLRFQWAGPIPEPQEQP